MTARPLYIGIPAVGWLYTAAAKSLLRLVRHAPAGSIVDIEDGWTVLPEKRNVLVERFLATSLDALLMVDSDMTFPVEMVDRLSAANQDVVGVLAAKRFPPHETIGGLIRTPDGLGYAADGNHWPIAPGQGLQRVDRLGCGALLVQRRVFQAVPRPWFEFTPARQTGEDFEFCKKVQAAGFELWADTDLVVGHLTVAPVFPTSGLRLDEPTAR